MAPTVTQGKTGTLPGIGKASGGKQKTIDGKGYVKVPPGKELEEAGRKYAEALDEAKDAAEAAREHGEEVLKLFKKSRCKRIRVETESRTWNFSPIEVTKLNKEVEQVKA